MSATIVLKPGRLRASLLARRMFGLFRVALMGAGLLLLAAAADAYRGEGRLMEILQDALAMNTGREMETDSVGAMPAEEGRVDPLTPRMRGALNFVSRRYRVSGDALEPIFVAAETSARALHLDPLLVVAVIAIESRFNPFSESVAGAQGLMQVIPRFHQDKLPEGSGELSFFDPVINVRVGTRILQEYIARTGDLVAGLQKFAGAADDPDQRYSNKVLTEKARLEAAVRNLQPGGA